MICPKLGYFEGKIIKQYATYSETILGIEYPDFIFIFYEIGSQNEDQKVVYNNIKKNKLRIISQIDEKLVLNRFIYSLSSIICCPVYDHFTGLIINNSYIHESLYFGRNYR